MAGAYIIGDESPFLKRVLIPFWIFRAIIMLIHLALYALVITGLGIFREDARRLADEYNTSLGYDGVLAIACITCAIIAACFIMDIVCIIKRARRTLSPPFFFFVNLAQTVAYTINFILAMVGARNGVVSVVIGVFIYLSFLGLLIYASVIYHRFRNGTLRGTYMKTNNIEAHNLVTNPVAFAGSGTVPNLNPEPYANDYPRADTYYGQHATTQAQPYSGAGYAQPYEPLAVGQQQPQQQGLETRSGPER
ncbi:hypothetical protein VTK26DRAFT_611 [Humicola hyalothermophila]